jgi:hypothetical protein
LVFFEKKPKPVQTDRFWFGSVILGKKPVQTGLTQFFPVWLGFFPVWFGLVWFFRFQAYKSETEPNWSVFSKF